MHGHGINPLDVTTNKSIIGQTQALLQLLRSKCTHVGWEYPPLESDGLGRDLQAPVGQYLGRLLIGLDLL